MMKIEGLDVSENSEVRESLDIEKLMKKSCLQCGRPWNRNTPITVMPADGEHVWWHTAGICKYRRH